MESGKGRSNSRGGSYFCISVNRFPHQYKKAIKDTEYFRYTAISATINKISIYTSVGNTESLHPVIEFIA
jgi:hypothetical protein